MPVVRLAEQVPVVGQGQKQVGLRPGAIVGACGLRGGVLRALRGIGSCRSTSGSSSLGSPAPCLPEPPAPRAPAAGRRAACAGSGGQRTRPALAPSPPPALAHPPAAGSAAAATWLGAASCPAAATGRPGWHLAVECRGDGLTCCGDSALPPCAACRTPCLGSAVPCELIQGSMAAGLPGQPHLLQHDGVGNATRETHGPLQALEQSTAGQAWT